MLRMRCARSAIEEERHVGRGSMLVTEPLNRVVSKIALEMIARIIFRGGEHPRVLDEGRMERRSIGGQNPEKILETQTC